MLIEKFKFCELTAFNFVNGTLDCLAIQLSTRKSCSLSVHVDNDLTRTGWFLFIRFEAVISRGINLKVAQNVKRKQTVLIWEPNL